MQWWEHWCLPLWYLWSVPPVLRCPLQIVHQHPAPVRLRVQHCPQKQKRESVHTPGWTANAERWGVLPMHDCLHICCTFFGVCLFSVVNILHHSPLMDFIYLFKCPKQQYMLCIYKLILSYGIVWSRWPHLRMPLPLLQRWPLPLPLLHLGPLSQSQMTLVLPASLLRPWPKPKRSVTHALFHEVV